MKIILHIFITALALFALPYIVSGIHISNFSAALVVALVIGVLSVTIKPIISIFTLPLNILTLGLFSFVINGFIFWLTAHFIKGFDVKDFPTAILGAFVIFVITKIVDWLFLKTT